MKRGVWGKKKILVNIKMAGFPRPRAGVRLCSFFIVCLVLDCSFALQCTTTEQHSNLDFKATQVLHINLGNGMLPQCDLQNTTPVHGGKKAKDCSTAQGSDGVLDCVKVSSEYSNSLLQGQQGDVKYQSKQTPVQGPNDDHFIIQTENDKGLHLVITHEPTHQLFVTGNNKLDQRIAYGMYLMNSGSLDQSIEHFTKLLKEHPWVAGAYFGRGTAHVRKGIQLKMNSDAAITDFSSVIRLKPSSPDGWIRRAEVYSPLGRIHEALSDINVALDLRPTSQLHLMSGTLHFMSENYAAAGKKFKKSLELQPDQPTALLYLGLSLYHRGRVKEAIDIYKKLLKMNSNVAEVHRSLGHSYRELGYADKSIEHFTAALLVEPNHAQTLQLRGIVHYMKGRPLEALADFKACVSFVPHNAPCLYMKGLCYATIGNYYEAVKATTKIILHDPVQMLSAEVIKAHYLKEYSRYLHSYLDTPITKLNPDAALDGRLRDHWAKSLTFNFQNYTEQPGISPNIREVETIKFSDFSLEAQILLCKSAKLGTLIQYHTDGFMSNGRHQRAMGLAILGVAQAAHRHFKSPRNNKNNKLTWRQMFEVAIKWRRIVDPDQPVFWLDLMPGKSVKAGFNIHMNLLRGQMKSVRYSEYFDKIFQFTKAMLQHFYRAEEFSPTDFKKKIEKAKNCEDLMKVLKSPSNPQPGLMLSTHVASIKNSGRNLEGLMLTLTETNFPQSGQGLVFSMDTATTSTRTSGYHEELDHIWAQLYDEVKKHSNRDNDIVGNTILTFGYYFFNLMPLTRGSSAVAYAVALGLFLAVGKEATGQIPKGKEVDLEAMIGGAPDAFVKQVKEWLGLKKAAKSVTSYPSVSETFPTLRAGIEALNVEFAEANCRELRIREIN